MNGSGMLNVLHQSIMRMIYERGGIDRRDVDVVFNTPQRSWAEQLLRPTINFFLYDMEEQTELRNSNTQTMRVNGRAIQRMPPRRFTLHYLVSAWSSEPADEYTILWRTLAVLLRHSPFPEELLESEVRASGVSVPTTIGRFGDAPTAYDLWSVLGVPPRPALSYNVIAPLDLELALDAPLVLQSSVRMMRPIFGPEDAAGIDRDMRSFGGLVCDSRGRPLAGAVVRLEGTAEQSETDEAGRYRLRVRRGTPGPYTVRVSYGEQIMHHQLMSSEGPSFDIVLALPDS